MTEIETLRAAKERLFERGWIKNSFGREEGPYCLVGALICVQGNLNYDHTVYRALANHIKSNYPNENLFKVQHFNDRASTIFDDIVDLIDRTIKTLEQEQEYGDGY